MKTTHVKLILKRVHCGNTESVHGSDAFYVAGTLTDGTEAGTQVTLMTPRSINDNQQIFPDHVLFDGEVAEDAVIRGGITAFDEDFAKDWAKKPEWLATAKDLVVAKLTASANPYAVGAGQVLHWGYFAFDLLASADKDDNLGSKTLSIAALGPAREQVVRKFYEKGDFLGYSSWNYSAYIEVQRPLRYDILTSDTWAPGWTHLVPYRFIDGPQHVIAYNAASGLVHFDSLGDDGKSFSINSTQDWAAGWSTVTTFNLALERYVLVYNKSTGHVRIDRLRKDGTGSDNVWDAIWAPGWSIVEPIGSPTYQADHVIVYNEDTGHVRVDALNPGGVGTHNVFDAEWASGWTAIMPFRLSGTDWHFLIYNGESGLFHIDQFDNPTLGSNTVLAGTWSPGWTHFMAYPKIVFDASPGHEFVAYNAITGDAHFDRVSVDGFEVIQQDTWAAGWSLLTPVLHGGTESIHSGAGMLVYNAATGDVHSDHLGVQPK